ncbi:hypothetical protein A2U01_0071115 [Trifolium medium]|uniref:Uncharacterized protein n=1 Tax=Trifolium medium TaxID=97028 RepID=A0A392SLW3_9FABA|nr:hypothetical protein [Trifolium medium]
MGCISRVHDEEASLEGFADEDSFERLLSFFRGFRFTFLLRIFRGDLLGFGEIREQTDVT